VFFSFKETHFYKQANKTFSSLARTRDKESFFKKIQKLPVCRRLRVLAIGKKFKKKPEGRKK